VCFLLLQEGTLSSWSFPVTLVCLHTVPLSFRLACQCASAHQTDSSMTRQQKDMLSNTKGKQRREATALEHTNDILQLQIVLRLTGGDSGREKRRSTLTLTFDRSKVWLAPLPVHGTTTACLDNALLREHRCRHRRQ
jgi:hypothetical protein